MLGVAAFLVLTMFGGTDGKYSEMPKLRKYDAMLKKMQKESMGKTNTKLGMCYFNSGPIQKFDLKI